MCKILCIETSTNIASVAISVDGLTVSQFYLQSGQNISSEVTLMIQQALSKANLKLSEIDAVAINLGPGSYTSLRVGLSAAKAISYATGKPLIGVDSFEILYEAVLDKNQYDYILCMVDARRMDAYVRIYDMTGNNNVDEFATLDESFFNRFAGKSVLCIGDGATRLKNAEFVPSGTKISEILQNASLMSCICHEKLHNGTHLDTAYSVPYYFKSPNITTPKNIF